MGADFGALHAKAVAAGLAAGRGATPTPMVVCDADLAGNPLRGGRVYEPVPDGPCGFAWVVVKPGNHPFANWAKKTLGARKHYGGGVNVYWVHEFNQAWTRKAAFARAYADTLKDAGIPAYADDRLD